MTREEQQQANPSKSHQDDISKLFRRPPSYEALDFYGGIEGRATDSDMNSRDPEKINSEEYQAILFLERKSGIRKNKDYVNFYEENAMTFIKRDYQDNKNCKTYLN